MSQCSLIRRGAIFLALCLAACNDSGTNAAPQLPAPPAGPYATLGELEDDVDAARAAGVPDTDGDSLPDTIEARLKTEAGNRDSDHDGLSDNFELFGTGFNRDDPLPDLDYDAIIAPLDSDDDADRINDGQVVDTDGDGIPNYLEYYGYTYDFLTGEFLAWNGDPAVPHYFTDPLQLSTDQDAYSDATEASGTLLDPSVEDPGADPLVPAYPNIVVELAGYTVTLNEEIEITQGTSLEKGRSWTRETEQSYSETNEAGWQVGGETSFGKESGVKISANYGEKWSGTNSTSSSVAVGDSVTSAENWSMARSVNPTDAARLKLFLKVHNRGTAPLSNLSPTLTLKIGGLNVSTFEPGSSQVHMLVPGGTYPADVGVFWTVATMADGSPLSLTMTELRALERGAPVSITVTQIQGDVMRLSPEATWERIGDVNEFVARCDAVCANIRIDLGDGQLIHHLVYADDSPSAPPMTVGQALGLIGVDPDGIIHYADKNGVLRTRSLSEFNFAFDDDTLRANGWTLAGDGAPATEPPPGFVLEETRLYPGTSLLVRAPRGPQATPGPVIHFAYLDSLTGEVKTSTADYQGIFSVEVVNDAGDPVMPLLEEIPGAGFYSGIVPSEAQGLLKVVVENLAGVRTEADLGRLFVEAGPQVPVVKQVTLDVPNHHLYANISSGNPGDPVSDIQWVRAYHPALPDGFLTMQKTIFFFEDPDGYEVDLPSNFTGKDVDIVAFVTDGVFVKRRVLSSEVIEAYRVGSVTLDSDAEWPFPQIGVTPYYYPATLDLDTGVKKRLGKTYGGETVPAGVDLYLWVTGNGKSAPAKLAFPGASYKKLGKVDYDALTKADLVNAQPASSAELTVKASGSTGIQVNDVLAIVTSDGRYAKLEVTDIVEGGDFWETYKSYDVTVKYVVFK
ncbi:MAG TPA: binary toxin-like calcium binding domain-containing protein [Planctomycetota bacterium]|nr:binary toxin-like calcium binding domain-containing protein [Planctomycetota bacterium]